MAVWSCVCVCGVCEVGYRSMNTTVWPRINISYSAQIMYSERERIRTYRQTLLSDYCMMMCSRRRWLRRRHRRSRRRGRRRRRPWDTGKRAGALFMRTGRTHFLGARFCGTCSCAHTHTHALAGLAGEATKCAERPSARFVVSYWAGLGSTPGTWNAIIHTHTHTGTRVPLLCIPGTFRQRFAAVSTILRGRHRRE